jgi:predicted Fe-S protein YdhL (DUF1289 family)
MGIIKGLGGIKSYNEEQDRKAEEREKGRLNWFSLKDKESANILFLQELDETAKGYDADRGIGFIAVEHTNPEDWRRKGVCTADDEDGCVGCEQNQLGWNSNAGKDKEDKTRYKGGWKARPRMYINVLVEKEGEEPTVAVLSQGLGGKQITPTVLLTAEEDGTITDQWFKVTRDGEKTDTTYNIIARPKKEVPDTSGYEVFDLDRAVRNVPYEEQRTHYGLDAVAEEPDEQPSGSSSSLSDDEW